MLQIKEFVVGQVNCRDPHSSSFILHVIFSACIWVRDHLISSGHTEFSRYDTFLRLHGLEHRSDLLAVFGNYPPFSGLCSQLVIIRRTFSHYYHLGILGLHAPHVKRELWRAGPRWVVRGLPVDVARSGLPGTVVIGLFRCLVVYVLGIEGGAAAGKSVVRDNSIANFSGKLSS